MQRIGDLMAEVLANTAKMVAEREKAIRGQCGVPGEGSDQRVDETVAIEGTRENTSAGTRLLPVVSQTGGGKSPKPSIAAESCLHRPMKGGHHDVATASRQARIGTARTETEIQ